MTTDNNKDKDSIWMDGLALVTMKVFSPLDTGEALRHVIAWPFVKGCFTDGGRGDIVVVIGVGQDCSGPAEYRERRDQMIWMMNMALRMYARFR